MIRVMSQKSLLFVITKHDSVLGPAMPTLSQAYAFLHYGYATLPHVCMHVLTSARVRLWLSCLCSYLCLGPPCPVHPTKEPTSLDQMSVGC